MSIQRSQSIFERAKQVIPGGVNSPVRACRSVGVDPVFVAQGDGAYITDVDGNRYVDLVGSWGPLILGNTHPEILDAIRETRQSGTTFGAPTEIEVRFAETIRAAYPSMQMVRALSSGTEATMSALRLARGFTARDTIVVPYNDLASVEAAFASHGGDIAAIIIEPIAGNMGLVPPQPGYLE